MSTSPPPCRIEVRPEATGRLRVTLYAAHGAVGQTFEATATGRGAGRALCDALAAALAAALRADATEVVIELDPPELAALLDPAGDDTVAPGDRAAARWLRSRFELFDRVSVRPAARKMAPVAVGAPSTPRGRVGTA